MSDQWKLVPVEPTSEMLTAPWPHVNWKRLIEEADDRGLIPLWRAMLAASPQPPAPEPVADFEEALRLCEIGEYLYSACAYSYGDGYTEPREYGIEWQWQQSAPGQYGQGMLLAASTQWHEEQAADGTLTEAAKLRAACTPPDTAAIREQVRLSVARVLAYLDGIILQQIKSTVGPEEDANNWRKYLGRADDITNVLESLDAQQ